MNYDPNLGRKRVFAIVVSVAAIAVASGHRAAADEQIKLAPHTTNPAQAREERDIRKASDAFVKAFNAGDAKAIGALWTPDGDYVDERGEVTRGRDAIAKLYTTLFANARDVKIEITIDTIRFAGKDAAIVKGTARAKAADGAKPTVTRFTAVHVKQDGKWLLESVHESVYKTKANAEALRDLEWLIGSWSAKSDTLSVELKCEWIAKRNFILCTHEVKNGDTMVGTSKQVIGWDPTKGLIRSWDFDSEGGFGSEWWARDGKRWVLAATGVRNDAGETEATNIITPVDASHFTWQSVHRRVNGAPLPDTPVIQAVRVQTKK